MTKHGDEPRVLEAATGNQQREPVHLYLRRVKDHGIGDEGKFSRVPKSVILALSKKPGALSLYALMMTYVGFDNRSSECYPSIATLARELDVSESTVRRNLRELTEQGLVKTRKKGRKNYYSLHTIPSNTATSATDTEQICEEYQSDLHTSEAGEGVVRPDSISDSETANSSEREPRKRTNKRDVQAGTSSIRRGKVKSFGISAKEASALIEQYGPKLVDAGVEHVLGRDGVRNQAALFKSYLKNDGWAQLNDLKDFLHKMPDPRTSAEQADLGRCVVDMFGGSKQDALDALVQVRDDQARLLKKNLHPDREDIAESILARAGDARHFVEVYARTYERSDFAKEFEEVLFDRTTDPSLQGDIRRLETQVKAKKLLLNVPQAKLLEQHLPERTSDMSAEEYVRSLGMELDLMESLLSKRRVVHAAS